MSNPAPSNPALSKPVFVAGATGGVGQLVVAKLLAGGYSVQALCRDEAKARQMFGDRVSLVIGDLRQPETLTTAMAGVGAVICCTGTTAFPSDRWKFDLPPLNPIELAAVWLRILTDAEFRNAKAQNGPVQADAIGVETLVNAAPKDIKRFVFISSCGITRKGEFPFKLLNGFGVLDAKERGEAAIVASGLPYTILRPARLIDGPFTSYDLNTLLQSKTDGQLGVKLGTGDRLVGQTSRIDVAAAAVACLAIESSRNRIVELVNEGARSAPDWTTLFGKLDW
jgi:uncharacterized protein YbjT (DUF2867 family)